MNFFEILLRLVKDLPQCAVIFTPRSERPTTFFKPEDKIMKKDRRWMKSIIAASNEVQVTLPWARGTRRRPEAMKTAATQVSGKPATRAMAAH